MATHFVRLSVAIAVVTASLATVVAGAAADARTASSVNACKLLSAKQVAAVHVGTSCTQVAGKPNPYYVGVSATWGKLGGRGSVIVAVNRVSNRSYISLFESENTKGKSFGVGSWSRGSCTSTGTYCIVSFVVGNNVVELQVAPPTGQHLASQQLVSAMAKAIAAKLS